MARLTPAQDVVLSILRDGGFINQGNLVLVDRNYICVSYDRRSLRELINRDLVRVSDDTLRWEARPEIEEEGINMTDENYYKGQADTMVTLLKQMAHRGRLGYNMPPAMIRQANTFVHAYEKHESTSGKKIFQQLARSVGADPAWYGHTIEWVNTIGGKIITSHYTITGINVDMPVNKIILTTSRGKLRKTSVAIVAGRLGHAKAPEERKRAIQL